MSGLGWLTLFVALTSQQEISLSLPAGKLLFNQQKGSVQVQVIPLKGEPVAFGSFGWFGYNLEREFGTHQFAPLELTKDETVPFPSFRWRCPFDPQRDGVHEGWFGAWEGMFVVRSNLMAKADAPSIVRVSPRFDGVDTQVWTHLAVMVKGKRWVTLHCGDLERPGYFGVRPWGGPFAFGALDAETPAFAFYNPLEGIGVLFLYPFYERFWRDGRIFFQRWQQVDYFYGGFFDGEGLGRDFLFAIVPLRHEPTEKPFKEWLREQAIASAQKLESALQKGILPFPRLQQALASERYIQVRWSALHSQLQKIMQSDPSQFLHRPSELMRLQILQRSIAVALQREAFSQAHAALSEMERILRQGENGTTK